MVLRIMVKTLDIQRVICMLRFHSHSHLSFAFFFFFFDLDRFYGYLGTTGAGRAVE